MPGMDGLQAVQAIKNDPRTATIPIMMYTSQEGELYLGQARALGAVGVLPKQIKPTRRLQGAVPAAPGARPPQQRAVDLHSRQRGGRGRRAGGCPPTPRRSPTRALREHFAELRRALVAGVDTQTDRITAEVRALLLEALPPPPAEDAPPPPRPLTPPWAWIVACAALAIALLSSALWWRSVQLLEDMDAQLTQLRRARPPVRRHRRRAGRDAGQAPRAPGATRSALPTDNKPIVVPVPYGADAARRCRVWRPSASCCIAWRSRRSPVVVDIKTFAGRFCLVGNTVDGYSLAPDETPSRQVRHRRQSVRRGAVAHAAHPAGARQPDRRHPRIHPRRARRAGVGGRPGESSLTPVSAGRGASSPPATGTAPPAPTTASRSACVERNSRPERTA